MTEQLVVAADGGNSKTDLVVATLGGTVLGRVLGAGTRPLGDGVPVTVDALVGLARRALADAGRPVDEPLAAGTFYLANVDRPDEQEAVAAELARRGLVHHLEVDNDTLAILRAGSRTGWGIAVTCGAGINAIGRTRDGRVERFLAIGGISGDWGGGGSLAEGGVGAAVRAGDGRGPATVLTDLVLAEFTPQFGRDVDDVAVAIQRGEVPAARFLAFAPVVLDAAGGGDAVATGIVHRLAGEVVDFVRALVARLGEPTAGMDVVLGGSVLQGGHPVLRARIDEGLAAVAPGARVTVLDVPPVAGALVAALEAAGAAPEAVERGRTALRRVPTAKPS